ncbi:MAG: lipopolysaccharide transport system permease protein [Ulvibacter sp.]|jgi:lipopolysaccharide transport system permease protein
MNLNRKTIIDAEKQHFTNLNLKELWLYKDLFRTLAWRDFKVRYAQTIIGLAWVFVQPIVTISILYLVFGRFANVPTNGIPHLVFIVAGTSLWSYFSYLMTNSGNSVIQAQQMISKIYFPRLIVPLSKAVVGFIDFGVNILILISLMIYYQISPSPNIIYAPIFILMGIIAALGVGIWLSALSIRFRDFQHIIPFMVQIGLYITPVAYPAEFATQKLSSTLATLYFLNPMAGVIQGFRWSVLGGEPPSSLAMISFGIVLLIFITSLFYFKSLESKMADIV